MPATPRGRDAATILAVLLAIVLAFAWLHSSDGTAPTVPAGVSVETLPAVAPEEAAPPAAAVPGTGGIEEGAGGDRPAARKAKRRRAGRTAKRRRADRADGREDARAPAADRGGRGRAGSDRQDPPATGPGPGPTAGSGGTASSGASAPPQPPEFALE